MTHDAWLVGTRRYVAWPNMDDLVAGGVGRHHCRLGSMAWWHWRRRGQPTRTAHQILDERYARGEIDREEYLRRRKAISGE